MQSKSLSESAVFDRFTSAFESFLLARLRKHGIEDTQSIDKNIALLLQTDPQALKKTLLATSAATIGRRIPENRLGDKIIAYMHFVANQRRTPRDQNLFNDVLYKIRTTDEIIDPLRVFVSDKEFVKVYIKAIVGDQYNVPTIDVIRSVGAIDDYAFPSDCCIKPTHLSGRAILRRDNEQIDTEKIKGWFSMNYYRRCREANYKTLKPKIIIEPLLFNNSNIEDYKFFCFNGSVKLIEVDVDRYIGHKRMFFKTNWDALDFCLNYPKPDRLIPRPDNLEVMMNMAKALCAGFGFIRVDMYSDGTKCFVGEITNCHGAAIQRFMPASAEQIASDIIFN